MNATSHLLKIAAKLMEKYADSRLAYLEQSVLILMGVNRELINLIASEKHPDFWPDARNRAITNATLAGDAQTLLQLLNRLRAMGVSKTIPGDPFSGGAAIRTPDPKVFDDCYRWLPGIINDLQEIVKRSEFDQARRHMNELETKIHDAQQWLERSKSM